MYGLPAPRHPNPLVRLGYAMRLALANSERRRVWLLWALPCWGVAIAVMGLGIAGVTGYLTANSPAYAAFLQLPGGLHTHGLVQFCIGAALAIALIEFTRGRIDMRRVQWVLIGFGVYCGIIALAFACAPLAPGGQRNAGWIHWAFFLFVAFLEAVLAPRHGAHLPSGPTDAGDESESVGECGT